MEIIDCTDPAQLYCRYEGEGHPQDTYIELDLRSATMSAAYNDVTSNMQPIGVRDGYLRRYPIPILTAAAANRCMREIEPLAARIVADWHDIEEDREPSFAILGVDAEVAEDEIEAYLDGVGTEDADQVAEWTIDEAELGDVAARYGITATTTDARLAEIDAEILRDLSDDSDSGAVAVPDLAAYLRNVRAAQS